VRSRSGVQGGARLRPVEGAEADDLQAFRSVRDELRRRLAVVFGR
jgi:hypothetical protein